MEGNVRAAISYSLSDYLFKGAAIGPQPPLYLKASSLDGKCGKGKDAFIWAEIQRWRVGETRDYASLE
jgi:hypothetical protein